MRIACSRACDDVLIKDFDWSPTPSHTQALLLAYGGGRWSSCIDLMEGMDLLPWEQGTIPIGFLHY